MRPPRARISLALAGFLLLSEPACSPASTPSPAHAAAFPENASIASEVAPAPAPAPPPRGHSREVTPRELDAMRELIAAAERVRGLHFVHDVPVLVQDPEAIMSYVDSQIKEDELERSRTIYTALGLLPPELDVRKLLLRLMGEQIVGYYDVEAHRLVVRDDVMRAFGRKNAEPSVNLDEARAVLVHELVHALQDQHLGLSESVSRKRDSDADNAFRALVEGDATLAMIAFALERESVPLSELTRNPAQVRNLSELVRGSPLGGRELGNAPPIVRVPLLSAYVDGLTFAAYLHGDGGWGRVDRAHQDPPVSTEQVLHPERFARRMAPEHLHLSDAKAALGDGFTLLYQDSLGELEMRVYFELGSKPVEAARAVQGWRGDRLYAYRSRAGETAIVWLSSFESDAEATRAERAASRVAAQLPQALIPRQLTLRSGRYVLVARNVPAELKPRLRTRFERFASELQPSARTATAGAD